LRFALALKDNVCGLRQDQLNSDFLKGNPDSQKRLQIYSIAPALPWTSQNTVRVVVVDPGEAAILAKLLSPGGAAGVVIDVDAQVDENVG